MFFTQFNISQAVDGDGVLKYVTVYDFSNGSNVIASIITDGVKETAPMVNLYDCFGEIYKYHSRQASVLIYAPAISIGVQLVLGYQSYVSGFFQRNLKGNHDERFTFGNEELVFPSTLQNDLAAAGARM